MRFSEPVDKMDWNQAYEQLIASSVYQEWAEKDTTFLTSVISQLIDGHSTTWDFNFYHKESMSMYSFKVSDTIELLPQDVPLNQQAAIVPLNLNKVTISSHHAIETVQHELGGKIARGFVMLTTTADNQIWNIVAVLQRFKMKHITVHAVTGAILNQETVSLTDMQR